MRKTLPSNIQATSKIFWIVLALVLMLIGCSSSQPQLSSVSSDRTGVCNTRSFETIVQKALKSTSIRMPRGERERWMSNIASALISNSSYQSGCKIRSTLVFPQRVSPGFIQEFPVSLSVLTRETSVCVDYKDRSDLNSPGQEPLASFERFPWKTSTVDVGGVQVEFREFLPVCFEEDGTILEYLKNDF